MATYDGAIAAINGQQAQAEEVYAQKETACGTNLACVAQYTKTFQSQCAGFLNRRAAALATYHASLAKAESTLSSAIARAEKQYQPGMYEAPKTISNDLFGGVSFISGMPASSQLSEPMDQIEKLVADDNAQATEEEQVGNANSTYQSRLAQIKQAEASALAECKAEEKQCTDQPCVTAADSKYVQQVDALGKQQTAAQAACDTAIAQAQTTMNASVAKAAKAYTEAK